MASFSNLCCPRCEATLKSRKALPIGEEISCAECKARLQIEVDDHQELVVRTVAKTRAAVLVASPHTPPPGEVERSARAVPKAKADRRRPPVAGRGKLVAAAAIAILFSIAGTTVAFFCFVREPVEPSVVKLNEPTPERAPETGRSTPPNTPITSPPQPPVIQAEAPKAEVKPAPANVAAREPAEPTAAPMEPQVEKPVQKADAATPPPPAVDKAMQARTQRQLEQQQKVDAAIARGVQYLKMLPAPTGSHVMGRVALRGLTLLECGVPADDPIVQQATLIVRSGVLGIRETYDASLAILFLDRLGDKRDTQAIQVLALRLVAGQTLSGGWNYPCPQLELPEMQQLIVFLQLTRPKLKVSTPLVQNEPPPFLVPLPENVTLQIPLPDQTAKLPDPLEKESGAGLPTPLPGDSLLNLHTLLPGKDTPTLPNPYEKPADSKSDSANPKSKEKPDSVTSNPADPKTKAGDHPDGTQSKDEKKSAASTQSKTQPKSRADAAPKFIPPQALLPRLRELPAVFAQNLQRGKIVVPDAGRDDNSNSQFALLALWTARRHGVATERVLYLAEQRYRQWQNADGGWGYMRGKGSTSAMTGVGLLGLAMGHGADFELTARNPATAPGYTDPAIERGLARFASFIGEPETDAQRIRAQNLYFLWSVERVAMLYRLRTICGKDWYGWGSQSLLATQQAEGSWESAPYPGGRDKSVDTCFALLFLRRSNLVEDLASNINQRIAVDAVPANGGKK